MLRKIVFVFVFFMTSCLFPSKPLDYSISVTEHVDGDKPRTYTLNEAIQDSYNIAAVRAR